jgi:DNA-binding response OmpR family regulator
MSKVLVIDDDATIVAIYRNAFTRQGFDVESAADGQAGLAKFHSWKPDVVLLDINIPELNGLEWLKTIRHEPDFAKFPVVVLTGGSTKSNVLSAWSVGATCVMLKSRDEPQRVIDVVKAVLGDKAPLAWGAKPVNGHLRV